MMWTDILWPFAVVTFEVLVFALVIYLTRRFTRSHDAEWATQMVAPEVVARAGEAPAPAEAGEPVMAPQPMVVARIRVAPKATPEPTREPERAAQGREPVGAA
jgi:hypothetical protein